MDTTKNPLAIVALIMLAIMGWTVQARAAQDGAPEPGKSTPATAAAPPAQSKQSVVLLLTNGQIVEGVVSEEDSMVIVTQPVGTMRFPRKRIEKILGSIAEVYQYKLEQLPEKDFDERLKLARWCLAHKMASEARQQLEAILQVNPKHPQAKAMVVAMEQEQSRVAMRKRDPNVQQTSGEAAESIEADRPNTLDTAVVYGAKRGLGISDLPVIFDLPPSQAVKRAGEFARYVHPVLQTYCARCHNDRYDGSFQLVAVKTRHDLNRETLAANLDATLKLIDRENPSRSELLASSLRPHGRGPNTRPIFQGSNDRAYQILATWVNSLKARRTPDGVSPAGFSPSDTNGTEGFAVDRSRISRASSEPSGASPVAGGPFEGVNPLPFGGKVLPRVGAGEVSVEHKELPPSRYVPGQGLVPDTGADPNEFPLPLAVGGTRPNSPTPAGANTTGSARVPAPRPPSSSENPALATDVPPLPDDAAPATTPKKPRKPLKIDPSILQKALQLKNQNR